MDDRQGLPIPQCLSVVVPEKTVELGKCGAPPAGLEPAPPAPEAGALSAELRGRELEQQGTMVLVTRTSRSPLPWVRRMLPYRASLWRSTTTLRRRRWSTVFSRVPCRSTAGAICTSAASTSSSSSSSSAPRCSSMTKIICARPAATPLRPGGRRRLRHQGLSVPGHGPPRPRGGDAPRRGVRWRAPRGAVRRSSARSAGPARQQQISRRVGDRSTAGRGPHRHRLVRRDRPPRRLAGVRPIGI